LEAYKKLVIKQRKMERDKVKKDARGKKHNVNDVDSDASEQDAQKLEQKIAELTERKQLLEGEIATAFSNDNDPQHLKRLTISYADIQKELEGYEAELTRLIASL
jgi:ATP-binding cassette subfamily F protein 3